VSTILNALSILDRSLDSLEGAVSEQEQRALKIKQQDLFNESNQANNAQSGIDINPALLAKKLDLTIERMEQLLQEG